MELAAAGILTPPGGLTSTASNYPCGLHRMLSQKVQPQHPLQPNRRPAALALRVERPQTNNQPRPRHHLLHLGQNLSRRVCFFFPAYSACEKILWATG